MQWQQLLSTLAQAASSVQGNPFLGALANVQGETGSSASSSGGPSPSPSVASEPLRRESSLLASGGSVDRGSPRARKSSLLIPISNQRATQLSSAAGPYAPIVSTGFIAGRALTQHFRAQKAHKRSHKLHTSSIPSPGA